MLFFSPVCSALLKCKMAMRRLRKNKEKQGEDPV